MLAFDSWGGWHCRRHTPSRPEIAQLTYEEPRQHADEPASSSTTQTRRGHAYTRTAFLKTREDLQTHQKRSAYPPKARNRADDPRETGKSNGRVGYVLHGNDHCMLQQLKPLEPCSAYGSSAFCIGPHREGTCVQCQQIGMGKESEMDERILGSFSMSNQAGVRKSVSALSERRALGDIPSPCFTDTKSRPCEILS